LKRIVDDSNVRRKGIQLKFCNQKLGGKERLLLLPGVSALGSGNAM